MACNLRALALLLLSASLIACSPAVEQAHDAVKSEVIGPVVAVRDKIEEAMPESVSIPADTCEVHPGAVALMIRYEVTSPEYYAARLESPIWPGAYSGVTWGIGYDGGQQTRIRIATDWHMHPQVVRLAETSGITGNAALALIPKYRDVRIPYQMAGEVFTSATLPYYCELAQRTFRDGWDITPPHARGALVATVYNRGASTVGSRRAEMRALRDECVPTGNTLCMADQFRSMERLWVGTPIESGMRARYEATARLATSDPVPLVRIGEINGALN